jgi:hypothetical protein
MATKTAVRPQPNRRARASLRNWQRVSVALPADIFSLEGKRSGLVLNLCARGAMVEMALPPRLGSEIIIHCGGIEAEGEVVWRRPSQCGIWFHTPLDEGDVDCEAMWSREWLGRALMR